MGQFNFVLGVYYLEILLSRRKWNTHTLSQNAAQIIYRTIWEFHLFVCVCCCCCCCCCKIGELLTEIGVSNKHLNRSPNSKTQFKEASLKTNIYTHLVYLQVDYLHAHHGMFKHIASQLGSTFDEVLNSMNNIPTFQFSEHQEMNSKLIFI